MSKIWILEFQKCKIIKFFFAKDKKRDRHKSKGIWGEFKVFIAGQSEAWAAFSSDRPKFPTRFAGCTIRWRLRDQSFQICKSFCHPGPWRVDGQDLKFSDLGSSFDGDAHSSQLRLRLTVYINFQPTRLSYLLLISGYLLWSSQITEIYRTSMYYHSHSKVIIPLSSLLASCNKSSKADDYFWTTVSSLKRPM